MSELKEVIIYTDGCCIMNPGPGGYGVILCYNNHEKELSGGFRLTTSNRMEITAAIIGLKALKFSCSVKLYCDSKYLVYAIMEGWVQRWKSNNWLWNEKEKATDVDLWDNLLNLCSQHTVDFIWVKDHAKYPYSERCDTISKEATNQKNLPIDEGYEQHKEQQNYIDHHIINPPKNGINNDQSIQQIQIEIEGKYYILVGDTWYDKVNFIKPPESLIHKLNTLLITTLERKDNVQNIDLLLKCAREARNSAQYEQSIKFARRVISISPDHIGAIAILCSCLRAIGYAQQALDETEAFSGKNYPPLITSRAAALCDLEKWEEAKKVISRVLAMSKDNDKAFSIVHRIKSAKPDLYK